MLYITWLNVVGVIPFITVAKSKMYRQGVKSTASGLKGRFGLLVELHWEGSALYFLLLVNTFYL